MARYSAEVERWRPLVEKYVKNPEWVDTNGRLKAAYRICIRQNENGTFANIRADKLGLFKGKISKNIGPYDCTL